MSTKINQVGGFCLNCDNRHGCRTDEPLCAEIEPTRQERYLPGKELMRRRGLLKLCRGCGHFRQCWGEESYRVESGSCGR